MTVLDLIDKAAEHDCSIMITAIAAYNTVGLIEVRLSKNNYHVSRRFMREDLSSAAIEIIALAMDVMINQVEGHLYGT